MCIMILYVKFYRALVSARGSAGARRMWMVRQRYGVHCLSGQVAVENQLSVCGLNAVKADPSTELDTDTPADSQLTTSLLSPCFLS